MSERIDPQIIPKDMVSEKQEECKKCGKCCRTARVHLHTKNTSEADRNELLEKVICQDGDVLYKVKLRTPNNELITWPDVFNTPSDAVCGALQKDNLCALHKTGKPRTCELYNCRK